MAGFVKSGGPRRISTWSTPALQAGSLALLALLWQSLSATGIIDKNAMPSFWQTLTALIDFVNSGTFVHAGLATLEVFVYGMVLSTCIGVPLGVLIGSNRFLYDLLRPTIDALRPIPPIVILPVAIMTVGTGLNFSAVLILQGAMWPLLIVTAYGVDVVPSVTLDSARIFKFSWWRSMVFVRMAQALPFIGSGLRIGAAIVFAVSVMAGYVAGAPGLGQQLGQASQANNLPLEFAITVLIGLFGIVIIAIFARIEAKTSRWRVVSD